MGGGDLNTKKSWHPKTIRNQEKVWKAEQIQAEENKKMNDLRKELDNERFNEEITHFGESSGVLAEKPNKKMDWMYKEPTQNIEREQYLLGKAIDKTFEKMAAEEQNSLQSVPKNHVEHECIPFSIRNLNSTNIPSTEYQVDIQRKLMEDPLVAIRKREVESRTQLLQNPVKLKQISMLLKAEQLERRQRKEMKKSKKNKKDKDKLEAKIFEKLKKLGNDELNIKSLLSDKSKKKKKKKKYSSDSDSDDEDVKPNHSSKHKSKNKHIKNRSESADSDSSDDEKQRRSKKHKPKNEKNYEKKSKDGYDSHKRKSEHSEDDSYKRRKHEHRSKDLNEKLQFSERLDKDKRFGLHRADGSKISPKREGKSTDKSRQGEKSSAKEWNQPARKKLSEEEKEERRKQMMVDAAKRDHEREKNVMYYKNRDKKEELKIKNTDYQKDFVEKQLRTAVSQSSVESRIKSNIYNIQRSYGNMDTNFARR